MAYENMTYEIILGRMLDRVRTDYPNLDDREGSIIFNALAPAAMELAIMYGEIDNALSETFISTASREYILLACEQMGIDSAVFEASAGTFKGEFDVEVPIGSRWNCDLYNYVIMEYSGKENDRFVYSMLCETSGSAPNNVTGTLTPITDVPVGLTYAELTECLIEGENEYSDDEVREYYSRYMSSSASDGNVGQYARWCEDFNGIGNYKILPLWNGANTVKVSVLSSSNGIASQELIDEFQEYLDPGASGMGDGVAPIGAIVTVGTATAVPITVEATVTVNSNIVTDEQKIELKSRIGRALTEHFSTVAYKKNLLSYMVLGAVLINVEGVESVTNMLVNGSTADIVLTDEQIPTLGETYLWGDLYVS